MQKDNEQTLINSRKIELPPTSLYLRKALRLQVGGITEYRQKAEHIIT